MHVIVRQEKNDNSTNVYSSSSPLILSFGFSLLDLMFSYVCTYKIANRLCQCCHYKKKHSSVRHSFSSVIKDI